MGCNFLIYPTKVISQVFYIYHRVLLPSLKHYENLLDKPPNEDRESLHLKFHHADISNSSYKSIVYGRKVSGSIQGKQKMKHKSGFMVTWYYSGKDVESESRYNNDGYTLNFIRYPSSKYFDCENSPSSISHNV